ncbi:MAG TPA: acetyl-CoA acetyltransferase [Acidimicrobiales bacterium]|nr:acetyl-CoA acetyltransferase [Acidimicrobiales bacterium]
MAPDPRTPVLAGVGQVLARPGDTPLVARPEPVDLMADALRAAADDCAGAGAGARLLARAESLRVLLPLSWRYVNPALLVADRLRIDPKELGLSAIGGNGPQSLAARSAADIAEGRVDVVLLTGAECIGTRVAARRDPDRPVLPWTTQAPGTEEPVLFGTDREPVTETERARGLDRPLRVFPLFETALRAHLGERPDDHLRKIAGLWSRFSEVAADNPFAWTTRAYDADEIGTVSEDNRMVSYPYPKRMNANDRVDMGAAFILCSLDAARRAGVPDDRLVFPVAAADAHDHWFLTHRHDLYSSPAIAAAARAAFGAAGAGVDDVAHIDLYSCFPCAVEMGAAAVGLPLDDPSRPLTVTGGLAFAGGPGNNYVSHSIATMAGRLRDEPGALGLVTGLGWYATKHAVGLWSSAPPAQPFRHLDVQAEVDAGPQRAPAGDGDHEGTVEAYTVVHGRDGRPELGIVAVRTREGARGWGNVSQPEAMAELMDDEACGRSVRLGSDGRVDLR